MVSWTCCQLRPTKVDLRLPGKGNPNSHGARPVHQIMSMMKWMRTNSLSIKKSLSLSLRAEAAPRPPAHLLFYENPNTSQVKDNFFT